ncbi:hypothetical protein SESBI_30307, partial [Sesbania bispinosa]
MTETQPVPKPAAEVQTEEAAFGPWMIVQRNARRNPKGVGGDSGAKVARPGVNDGVSRKSGGQINAMNGSRFSALHVGNINDEANRNVAENKVDPDIGVRKPQSEGPKFRKGKDPFVVGERKSRKPNDEGSLGVMKHQDKEASGSVTILQRENVKAVGGKGLGSTSNVGHHIAGGNVGPSTNVKGRRFRSQPSGANGPDPIKAKVGLNLKSQVKFKSIKNAARRGITLTDLPMPLIQASQLGEDMGLANSGLGAEEGMLVFNNRPPDITQGNNGDAIPFQCVTGDQEIKVVGEGSPSGALVDLSSSSVVRDAWCEGKDWILAAESFKCLASKWNEEHFGNISHKKKRILARLEGVTNQLNMRPHG